MNPQNSNLISYSVMWLKEDLPAKSFLYRDFLLGVDESMWRSARLLPWYDVYPELY